MSQPGLTNYERGLFIYNFCWGLFSQALNKIWARHYDAMQILSIKQRFATRMSKALKRKILKRVLATFPKSTISQYDHPWWRFSHPRSNLLRGIFAQQFRSPAVCAVQRGGAYYRKTDKNVYNVVKRSTTAVLPHWIFSWSARWVY